MSDRTRSVLLFLAAALFLFVAILWLLPIAFVGDPAEGKEYVQQEYISGFLLLSSAFGFASMMFLIRAFQLARERHFHSRRQLALTGLLLVGGAVLLGSWALGARSDSGFRMAAFFMSLVVWYLGGGFLLTSVRRPPIERTRPPAEDAASR